MIIKKKVIMQTVIIIHFLQLPEDNFKPVKLHANNINIDFLCVTDRYDIPIVYEPGIDKNKEFVLIGKLNSGFRHNSMNCIFISKFVWCDVVWCLLCGVVWSVLERQAVGGTTAKPPSGTEKVAFFR